MLKDLLSGQDDSPAADMICLNAGAALLANELVCSFSEGTKLAHATLREGKAKRKLEDVISYTQMLAG
jgi:anthranilate phosphoribosyltransferase